MQKVLYFWLLAYSSLFQIPLANAEEAPCHSCLFQINSLESSFPLSGKWLFTRDDVEENKNMDIDTSTWKVIQTPGTWKGLYPDNKNYTTGWYRGEFHFSPNLINKEVVFLLDPYMSRVTFYLDGAEIYKRPNRSNIERYFAVQAIPIRFKITKEKHTIAFRIQGPLMAGVYQLPFELREYKTDDWVVAFYQYWGGEMRMFIGYTGFLFGLFFLLIYFKTRFQLYLYVALNGITMIPYFIMPGDALLRIFDPEPLLYLHYNGLLSVLFSYYFSQYLNRFTPKLNIIFAASVAIFGIFFAWMAISPNLDLFLVMRRLCIISLLVLMIGIGYHAYYGMKMRKQGGKTLFFATIVFFIAGINDNLLSAGLINSTGLLLVATMYFLISMLIVASRTFANTFLDHKLHAKKLKLANENLEKIVSDRSTELRRKTNDVQAILENIPQGILTITTDNKIDNEYSKYLETIFETSQVADQSVIDFLFARSSLALDQVSQMDGVMLSCIGQSRLNFDFNSHLLLTEYELKSKSGKLKSLELNWAPICNDKKMIEKLMVCVRDVSDLKNLAAESHKQRSELEIIGQILSVSQDNFHDFVETTEEMVGESKKELENTNYQEPSILDKLFRIVHTIKGSSRTFGFLQITNKIHDIELGYQELRKNPELQWNKELLLKELDEIQNLVKEYDRINNLKLGRKEFVRNSRGEKYILIEKTSLAIALERMTQAKNRDTHTIREALKEVRTILQSVGYSKLSSLLVNEVNSLPSLAKELDKPIPNIAFDETEILIRNQCGNLLKNVFIHIFRNAIDHGIESQEERRLKAKPLDPTIHIQVRLQDNRLRICVSDDGKGLDLQEIRKKAVDRKLISTMDAVNDTAAAQYIFHSGFSTAKRITQVSGRGVGLDAVKTFLEKEGGSVHISFLGDDEGKTHRAFEMVLLLPKELALGPT